jgi:hypothetical protein
MTVQVECKVKAENNRDLYLIVKNHPFFRSVVTLKLNNEEYSFIADDVITAIKNAVNCNH